MKLVVDNSNVETIPVGNLQDIAGMARRFAEDVDEGKHGDITSVTLLIETGDGLKRESWGEMPSAYEIMGMFFAGAIGALLPDDVVED